MPTAGTYTISWRYSNGEGSDRPASLLVNGSTVVSLFLSRPRQTLPPWTTVQANVNLNTGNTDLRLQATGSGGLANIDNISVQGPSSVTGVSCTTQLQRLLLPCPPLYRPVECHQYLPNPSNHVFNINAIGNFKYFIFDQLGRMVEKGTGLNKTTIGQRLIQGTYTVQIEQEGGSQVIKILKRQ